MTERTTDPDAGLEELAAVREAHRQFRLAILEALGMSDPWAITTMNTRRICEKIAALRERAERAQEQYERAMSIIREDELEDLAEQRDRLRVALEEQQEAQRLIMEEVLPKLRQLIANGCVSTAVGAIDELAATWCGVETVDQLLARRALSDSPAPEVRDA